VRHWEHDVAQLVRLLRQVPGLDETPPNAPAAAAPRRPSRSWRWPALAGVGLLVVLAATLQAIPAIPAIGLVLVLSVDWFMGIARALGNLIGNCVATVAVAAWEGDIDRKRAHAVLDGRPVPATEDDADVMVAPVPARA